MRLTGVMGCSLLQEGTGSAQFSLLSVRRERQRILRVDGTHSAATENWLQLRAVMRRILSAIA